MSDIEIDGLPPAPGGGRRRLAGATAGMAVGTTLSRLTGVGRVIALTAALGGGGFADAYNLANTTPNIITDIVIGGVLAATFVPVFVSQLTTRPADEAWEAISAVVTVTVDRPGGRPPSPSSSSPRRSSTSTPSPTTTPMCTSSSRWPIFLLRWFVPQLTCYGLIALFTALLNTRGKFAAPMFVPIANNLVVIAVLVWFHALVPHPDLASIDAPPHRAGPPRRRHHPRGGGPGGAAGPSLLRRDLHLRFRWQPGATRPCAGSPGWPDGPSGSCSPTRWPWWWSWRWPTGPRCPEPCRPTPTPTPSSSCPTGWSPSR